MNAIFELKFVKNFEFDARLKLIDGIRGGSIKLEI